MAMVPAATALQVQLGNVLGDQDHDELEARRLAVLADMGLRLEAL